MDKHLLKLILNSLGVFLMVMALMQVVVLPLNLIVTKKILNPQLKTSLILQSLQVIFIINE